MAKIKTDYEPGVNPPADNELFALQIIITALQELDSVTRKRVLDYVNRRFETE